MPAPGSMVTQSAGDASVGTPPTSRHDGVAAAGGPANTPVASTAMMATDRRDLDHARVPCILGSLASTQWCWVPTSLTRRRTVADLHSRRKGGTGDRRLRACGAPTTTPMTAMTGPARRHLGHGGPRSAAGMLPGTSNSSGDPRPSTPTQESP